MAQSAISIRSALAAFAVILQVCTLAGPARADGVAKLYGIEGQVEMKALGASWKKAELETSFQNGDAIRTGDASRAAILGADGFMVRLGANALFEFRTEADGTKELHVESGDAHILNRDPHAASKVTTTYAAGSILGTEVAVSVLPGSAVFTVIEGNVSVENDFGRTTIASGEEAVAAAGSAPQKRLIVKPLDRVQWALRYPAVISVAPYRQLVGQLDQSGEEGFRLLEANRPADARTAFAKSSIASAVGMALCYWLEGERGKAVDALRQDGSPAARALLAGLLLEGGEVEKADRLRAQLEHSATGPLRAILSTQEAVTAVTRNDPDRALALLNQQTASADKLFIESVVYQSQGDVEKARDAVMEASDLDPSNPRLLARLAELEFGLGNLEKAEEIIARALAINSHDVDAQVVHGFLLLARSEAEEARDLFEDLLEHDSSNAEIHMGLGLAMTRLGDPESGRLELQKAVHLEPTSSIYRSYLGKAFFETNREEKAGTELDIASSLDPLDPTPFLYKAFNDLATFRPVSALGNLEESIARNDNRAVYRSRLLLDRDHATRSAGLGRVFNALDFIHPAQVEALKSLTEDPTNYAAHLLLKDSLFENGINAAFVAEDVTATLLAPSNFNTLLPTAVGNAGLNDYTSLFERSQSRTIVEMFGATEERLFEASTAHLGGGTDYSYLVRYGMTYGDGYRDNDRTNQQTGRVLAQYDLTPEDKLLLEGIVIGSNDGDTSIGLNPGANDPDFGTDLEDYTIRTGYRHTWSAESQTIAQALFVDSSFDAKDRSADRVLPVSVVQNGEELGSLEDAAIFNSFSRTQTEGVRGDIQHLYTTQGGSLVAGMSALNFDDHRRDDSTVLSDAENALPGLAVPTQADLDTHAYRGYGYGTLVPAQWLRATVGYNYTDLKYNPTESAPFADRTYNVGEWNPRVGLMVLPTSTLTLRGAYWEDVGTASARDLEGIEPSYIGGIRRLYDDLIGQHSKNWGAGVDWKAPKNTYVGSEFLFRELSQDQTFVATPISIDADTGVATPGTFDESANLRKDEYRVRSYVNQVVTSTLVANLEHVWAELDDQFYGYETRTHRVRAGLNYFHPSGFFSFGSGTWRRQDRDHYEPGVVEDEDFWIFSAGMGYQFPHRRGFMQLAVRNLLNESYRYVPMSGEPVFYPSTDVSLSIHFNF